MVNIIDLKILDSNKMEFVFYLIDSLILNIKEKFLLFQLIQKYFVCIFQNLQINLNSI